MVEAGWFRAMSCDWFGVLKSYCLSFLYSRLKHHRIQAKGITLDQNPIDEKEEEGEGRPGRGFLTTDGYEGVAGLNKLAAAINIFHGRRLQQHPRPPPSKEVDDGERAGNYPLNSQLIPQYDEEPDPYRGNSMISRAKFSRSNTPDMKVLEGRIRNIAFAAPNKLSIKQNVARFYVLWIIRG
ncbi:hypothetical protein L2E82_01095 [Cichorium intybus]|uniref:Uncharacterized protein n=1 Tax=Cichorium intybus TaxID=13427 RepID=A0ACB9GXL1_CICIN|nr:hypothetical protein L2E82_01095 [Cichorium intybus]